MWCVVTALFALGACAATIQGRPETDVVFTKYSSLSGPSEVTRRALSPITYRRSEEDLAAKNQRLADQAIDLAKEKFDIYVPSEQPPPAGYGLLVYVPPWDEPTRPKDWYSALENHKLIFVAAQGTGNDKSVLNRRIPLAILAYENVKARFPLNPQRVFIAGFSGGSRVAGMVAMAYPDVFRGVILNAGSDSIDGTVEGEGNVKPPAELFHVFQRSRLVYVTGEDDQDHVQRDKVSRESMRNNCVLDIREVIEPRVAHLPVDGIMLDRALDALEAPAKIDADELAHCNERVESKITAALGQVSAAIARGDRESARTQLMAIDAHYGGLAAPRSLELYAKIAAMK